MGYGINWVCSTEEAERVLLQSREYVAIDIETVDLENTLPIGIGLAVDSEHAYYFYDTRDPLLAQVLAHTPTVVAHNAKFDIPQLKALGHQINNYEDTRTLAYSNGIMQTDLANLSETLLNRNCPSVTSLWSEKQKSNIGVNHIELGHICMIHASNTYALWDHLAKSTLYKELDRPYLDLIIEMEGWGLEIDQYALTLGETTSVLEATTLEAQLYSELGDINLASNPQVAKALQAKGILGTRKTKSGADSVSDESLAPLHNPIADLILQHRKLMKTINTYVPLFRSVDGKGRIYTQFGYAETGRLTSKKPNHQNITNNWLRGVIKASRGYTFLSLDASQLELRVVAELSQDPLMIEACKSSDLHLATAIQVFGHVDDPEEMITRRYNAKQINFATLYGASEFKIGEMIGCGEAQASEFIQAYFSAYKVLGEWIEARKKEARRNGYVTNLFGRIRPLPDLFSGSWKLQEKGEREVVNTIVQGTAADIVKKAQMYLKEEVYPDIRFVLQVHDEILLEVTDELVEYTLDKCSQLSLAFPQYPFTIKMGKNYGALEKVVV